MAEDKELVANLDVDDAPMNVAGVANDPVGQTEPLREQDGTETLEPPDTSACPACSKNNVGAADAAPTPEPEPEPEPIPGKPVNIPHTAGFHGGAEAYYQARVGAPVIPESMLRRQKAKQPEYEDDPLIDPNNAEDMEEAEQKEQERIDALQEAISPEEEAALREQLDEYSFDRKVARLMETVTKQPTRREIMYKILVYCKDDVRPLRELEQKIGTFPGFRQAACSQYRLIQFLEDAGGLERFELDAEGEVVLPEQKVGLTEDEIDDLVETYAFMTTEVGLAVVEQHTPRARIIELLGLVPERKGAYIELMDFCSEEPRTYNEIHQLFEGRDVLYRMVDGEPQRMQPSVFVDKLEAAAGIEWRDGWVLTEEGRAFLDELRQAD